MKWHELKKLIAVVFALSIVAAACGGSGSDSAGGDSEGAGDTSATTAAPQAGDEAEGDVDTEVEERTDAPDYGGTVSIGLEAEATGLRPWEDACSSPCYNMMISIYDKLTEQASDGSIQPYLAESITPNADFTEYVMTLRPGVTFHNGTELTAQTIADMFPLQQEGAAAAGSLGSSKLIGVEATGDLEVTYTLSGSNSAFPSYLSRAPLGMVFDPAAAAADPEGYSTAPIGTGPFVIEKRDLDNETVVVRNDNYWMSDADGNQLPYLDSIVFKPIPDEGTRLDALTSGTNNAMQTLRQGTIRDARAVGDSIVLFEHQGSNTGGGMFNVAVAPYDDLRVRKGLTLMNDQAGVIEALGGTGISLPSTQWFSADSPWWSQKAADAWPQFDFEAGKAMVQEYVDDPERSDGKAAGEPIDVELSCQPDPTLIAAMQVLEQVWTGSELVNVTLTNFDQQTHINNALGADNGFIGVHGAHCWRWSSEDDPSISLNPFLAPYSAENAAENGLDGIVSPSNFANWFSPEAFQLAQEAIATDDFETRKGLYEQINLIIGEEQPIWYSGSTATAIGVTPDIRGLNSWTLPSGDLGIGHPSAEGRWTQVYMNTK
ncbi:MAG: ABC transporter substrate-binding protein [Acidimicrobiales bacterium]